MIQIVEKALKGAVASRLCRAAASGWQVPQFSAEKMTG
jgi:hypothetical protein